MEDPWWCRIKTFIEHSTLQEYLTHKPGPINWSKRHWDLVDIMNVLEECIQNEKMYDKNNPIIVILSPELEDILNVKFCSIYDLPDYLERHFVQRHFGKIKWNHAETKQKMPRWARRDAKALVKINSVPRDFDTTASYKLSPKLKKALQKKIKPVLDPKRNVFEYKEITEALSIYLRDMENNILVDYRSIRVANITKDPLKKAFSCNFFSRDQVSDLLRSQLIPL